MYQIKVLSDKEFRDIARSDKRYSNVDDSNLGFADPEKRTAYVRQSSWPDLNKYLINHEFEHLIEEEGTDEDENGIRHKKFFKEIFMPYIAPVVAAFIPGLGPLASAGLSAGVGAVGQGMAQKEKAGKDASKAQDQVSSMNRFFPSVSASNQGIDKISGTSQVPTNFSSGESGSSVSGNLLGGSLLNNTQSNFSPDLMSRLKGFFSGRIAF
jgi:hypothetical protein